MATRRTWEQLAALYADNLAGEITAGRLRDGFTSVAPHVAAGAPSASDDIASGFDVGHAWVDTSASPRALYVCVDPSLGAAVWASVYPASGGGLAEVDWGDIGGTLANQADLVAALDAKVDTSAIGTAAAEDASAFATAAQGATADAALPASSPRAAPTPVGQADGRMLAVASDALIYVDAPAGGGGGGDGIAPADGVLVVKHGANGATARPTAGSVYWQGSADPINRALGDIWLNTPAYD